MADTSSSVVVASMDGDDSTSRFGSVQGRNTESIGSLDVSSRKLLQGAGDEVKHGVDGHADSLYYLRLHPHNHSPN
jgi:hypothetical protein